MMDLVWISGKPINVFPPVSQMFLKCGLILQCRHCWCDCRTTIRPVVTVFICAGERYRRKMLFSL